MPATTAAAPTVAELAPHRQAAPSAAPLPRASSKAMARLAVAAPAALAVAVFVHPNDTSDAADSLGRIAGDERGRWVLAHIAEPVAWLLLAVVFLAAARIRVRRSQRLVTVGAALAAVGAAASALIVYSHGEAFLHATEDGMDPAAMQELYTTFEEAMPLAGPLAILFRLGLVALGIGLHRSKAVPRWSAIALLAAPFVMVPAAVAPPAVGAFLVGVPLVVGLVGARRAIADASVIA